MLRQTMERVFPRVFPPITRTLSSPVSASPLASHSRITLVQTFARDGPRFRSAPRVPHQPQTRTFSSSGHRRSNGGYNRFNDSGPRNPRMAPLHQLMMRARTEHFVILGLGTWAFYYYNTEEVEMTGRRRLNLISAERERELGEKAYREILREFKGHILPNSHPTSQAVHRVLERLIPQAHVEGAQWRAHVIAAPGEQNAFVLPGGKVFVFTGILPFCADEQGLAAVLAHEIAHVVAHHGAEGMTRNYLLTALVTVVSLLFDVSGVIPAQLSHFLIDLPNSRVQEAEADDMGLIMMARACYNPAAAIAFWHRMAQNKQAGEVPQLLSTHPSNENRLLALNEKLSAAQAIYHDSGCGEVTSFMPGFRKAVADHEMW
ncbi:M48 family metallopeptidase [Aspergillus homomorphus CBS 101889]|uniref:Peptidase n=1 Tax=Aspergillus homomorphus (strain CBS 101889) TaxID=1450537 RepID=A0A395HUH6_ASPHC|nr:peptidase [Aspergillus homomorphus CBS 101889]RAL11073.1 peptidase [Aspergillus homomorphus CBS 101889]